MRTHKKTIIIAISVVLMLFQSPLSRSNLPGVITSFVKNFDEIVTFIFALFLVLRFLIKGIPRVYIKELILFSVFLVVGLLGTVINRLQPANAVIEDIVNCSKFFITFLGVSVLFKRTSSKIILDGLQKISIILIVCLFALTLMDLAFPQIFSNNFTRYGIHAVHLFYYHPAVLAQVIALLLSIISVESIDLKYITVYKIMCLIILATTLRSKSFGLICLYLFVWLFDKAHVSMIKILLIMLAFLMIGFISFDNIRLYYGDENTARATLTTDAISLANSNIPIGLGFGTFASASAAKYYSPVYENLGYESRYGMGYVNTDYLTDSFWPVILGEFGYIGLIAYIGFIALLLKRSILLLKVNRKLGIAAVSIIGYLLICSTAATAFFNPIAVPNAIILALVFNVMPKENR